MDEETPQQKATDKGRKNSKLQDRQRQEGDWKRLGLLVRRFRVLLGTVKQRPRVVKDTVCTCVVLHNMLRTHQGGADRAPTPANEGAAL